MMRQPTTRSNRQIYDRLRFALRLVGSCPPDFAGWSGYPPIAALTIDPEIDVMGHLQTHAAQQVGDDRPARQPV
jgi:hypothetical protein